MSITNPAIAYGLGGITDYNGPSQFLNIAKSARALAAGKYSGGAAKEYNAMLAAGDCDENGYPTRIPSGYDFVNAIVQFITLDNGRAISADDLAYLSGRYVLTYAGKGTIALNGTGFTIVSSVPGRIVFDLNVVIGTVWGVIITVPDGDSNGNYIRDIVIVAEKWEGLYAQGVRFNPDYFAMVSKARVLRGMDWQNTNLNLIENWADRPLEGDWCYRLRGNGTYGAPIEVLVSLANAAGCDLWANVPFQANDTFITNMAQLIFDTLRVELKWYEEWANEPWNFIFLVADYCVKCTQPGDPNYWWTAGGNNYEVAGFLATHAAQLVSAVYASAMSRVVRVMGTQTGYAAVNDYNLLANAWSTNYAAGVRTSPDGKHTLTPYVAPYTVFDAMAKTCYFSGGYISQSAQRADLCDRLSTQTYEEVGAWITNDMLTNAAHEFTIPYNEPVFAASKAKAGSYGLALVNYEGGSHMHHAAGIGSYTPEQHALIDPFMSWLHTSSYMGTIYDAAIALNQSQSEGPFMQFVDMAFSGQYGSFGMISNPLVSTPRRVAVEAANEAQGNPYLTGGTKYVAKTQRALTAGQSVDVDIVGGTVVGSSSGKERVNIAGSAADYFITKNGAGEYTVTKSGFSLKLVGVDCIRYGA